MIVCPVSLSNLHLEGGVLLGELVQGRGELLLVVPGLRLDGDGDNRVGENHGFEDHLVFLVAERVPRRGLLQSHGRGDVARVDLP